MHKMGVSDLVMGGDIHARYEPFESINCDNDDDINKRNAVNNEQAQRYSSWVVSTI